MYINMNDKPEYSTSAFIFPNNLTGIQINYLDQSSEEVNSNSFIKNFEQDLENLSKNGNRRYIMQK